MPHYNCESCGAGLYSAARPLSLIDPSCPTCGASIDRQALAERNLLEAVAEHRLRPPQPLAAVPEVG